MAKTKKSDISNDKVENKPQSGSGYVPGSIASFLGSTQHAPPTAESALSTFFKPSVVKQPRIAPATAQVKAKGNVVPPSRREVSTDSTKKISAQEEKFCTNKAGQKLTPRPKRKRDDVVEPEAGPAPKRKWIQQPEDPAVLSRTVFVGNLSVTTTKKELKGLFKKYGQIDSMRFRSLAVAKLGVPKKVAAIKQDLNPKRDSFNAYIVFKDDQGAEAALQSNGMLVNKHHIRVDSADNSKRHNMKQSVFVGNIPFKMEDEEFRDHFSKCGPIEGVRLIRDKQTGVGKGFGYVLFQDTSSVQLALKMDGLKLSGRQLRVKRAIKKEKYKEERDHPTSRKTFAHKRNNQKTFQKANPTQFHGHRGKQTAKGFKEMKGKQTAKGFKEMKGKQTAKRFKEMKGKQDR